MSMTIQSKNEKRKIVDVYVTITIGSKVYALSSNDNGTLNLRNISTFSTSMRIIPQAQNSIVVE